MVLCGNSVFLMFYIHDKLFLLYFLYCYHFCFMLLLCRIKTKLSYGFHGTHYSVLKLFESFMAHMSIQSIPPELCVHYVHSDMCILSTEDSRTRDHVL